jgi:hypothetical protein
MLCLMLFMSRQFISLLRAKGYTFHHNELYKGTYFILYSRTTVTAP